MRSLTFVLVAIASLGAPFALTSTARASVEDDNKQLVRRFTEEVYNQRQKAKLDVYVHPEFVDHSPGTGPDSRGVDYVKAQWEGTYAAFPDLRFRADDVIADGDKVVLRWTSEGTFSGALGGVPGNGQKMTVQGVSIFRVQDGKFIESWDFVDRVGMFKQAGFKVVPPEKPAAK